MLDLIVLLSDHCLFYVTESLADILKRTTLTGSEQRYCDPLNISRDSTSPSDYIQNNI